MPIIAEKDMKLIDKLVHGVLTAGKIISLTIDGVENSYTVPAGKKLDYSVSLRGEVKAA